MLAPFVPHPDKVTLIDLVILDDRPDEGLESPRAECQVRHIVDAFREAPEEPVHTVLVDVAAHAQHGGTRRQDRSQVSEARLVTPGAMEHQQCPRIAGLPWPEEVNVAVQGRCHRPHSFWEFRAPTKSRTMGPAKSTSRSGMGGFTFQVRHRVDEQVWKARHLRGVVLKVQSRASRSRSR
jgi:hypothetical protein